MNYSLKPIPHSEAVIVNGEYVTQPPCYREPLSNEFVVIDWVSFTFSIHSFDLTLEFAPNDPVKYKDYLDTVAYTISEELEQVIGFGIDSEAKAKNRYDYTYNLKFNAGTISLGGQNDTVLIMINGKGCTYGEFAWQYHICDFMRTLHRLKITRLDLAFDDLEGEVISPQWADEQDDLGGFAWTNRYPETEKRGDWKRPNGKGLSFYVGAPTSSKRCVFYEKGKQLGDKNSKWNRCELRLKGKHYHIPIEAIESPTKYFITAYPCFEKLFDCSDITPTKVELIKRSETINIYKSIEILKHQYGKHLYAYQEHFNVEKEDIYNLLIQGKNEFPKRMDFMEIPNRYNFSTN